MKPIKLLRKNICLSIANTLKAIWAAKSELDKGGVILNYHQKRMFQQKQQTRLEKRFALFRRLPQQ